jgi:peptidoglycan/xylan/chitin deacetylase (PgdA/CDA1 family)
MLKVFAAVMFCCLTMNAGKGVSVSKERPITHFQQPANVSGKVVAFTFDACESKKPSYFDEGILNYLVKNKIPASIFLSGKFARRNATEIRKLKKDNFIEFENHSLDHYNHMEKLSRAQVIHEIEANEKLVTSITGRKPEYFRFPAGNYNAEDLHIVDSLGLKVVHWTYASGDPDKHINADKLTNEVLTKTRSGDILIFHINRRGWHTAEALPRIVEGLKAQGYTFVKLDQVIK